MSEPTTHQPGENGKAAAAPAAAPDFAVTGPRVPVSVIILTQDEEANVRECIASCQWSDDVHVLDSGSTDATCDIARRHGARVWVNPFKSFGQQRNWAIDNVEHKHDWVFHLDADERFTPELVEEMRRLIEKDPNEAGFYVPHKLMFMGRWLRLAGGYPVYQMRLFHRGRMRFTDHGHGQREQTEGEVGTLRQPYLHFNISKGLDDWFEKHNRYSTQEAMQILAAQQEPMRWGALLGGDTVARRRVLKRLWYSLPFGPLIRWVVTMFVMGGILEGAAGRTYASLLATYERMILLKLRLLRMAKFNPHARLLGLPSAIAAPRKATRVVQPDEVKRLEVAVSPPATVAVSASRATSNTPNPVVDRPMDSDLRRKFGADMRDGVKWPYPKHVYVLRFVWAIVYRTVWRLAWRRIPYLRTMILRLFGAKVGRAALSASTWIEMPWDLEIGDHSLVGPRVHLYNLGGLKVGSNCVISQDAYLCGGTHDSTDPTFPLIRKPIVVGDNVWIAAGAFIHPGVTIGDGAVVGARAVVTKDVPPWTIVSGNPAKVVRPREMRKVGGAHEPEMDMTTSALRA
jgi:acetyltransferase-like isoleucine patch superfamily enzyme/glycosyltransferase involved in cell wall biosynthesis